MFWEFATDHYDLGFGVYFEWTDSPEQQVSVTVGETSDEDSEDGKFIYALRQYYAHAVLKHYYHHTAYVEAHLPCLSRMLEQNYKQKERERLFLFPQLIRRYTESILDLLVLS